MGEKAGVFRNLRISRGDFLDPFCDIGTMTGLLDIFGRHFVVLTNFLEIEVNSRPIGQEAAICEVLYREGPAGPDRARRVVQDCPRRLRSSEHWDHPLQAPAGPSGARSAVPALSSSKACWLGGYGAGYRYSPPRYPPVYPYLGPYPVPVHRR